jgi:hypothetical protein
MTWPSDAAAARSCPAELSSPLRPPKPAPTLVYWCESTYARQRGSHLLSATQELMACSSFAGRSARCGRGTARGPVCTKLYICSDRKGERVRGQGTQWLIAFCDSTRTHQDEATALRHRRHLVLAARVVCRVVRLGARWLSADIVAERALLVINRCGAEPIVGQASGLLRVPQGLTSYCTVMAPPSKCVGNWITWC